MEISTGIDGFNREFNLNAISDYNKYLQGQASFNIGIETNDFAQALEQASKSTPLHDKNTPDGLGNFADKIGMSLGGALNSVNATKLEAERLQEDLATAGPTSIHDAMIAAEKADLSMQMAVQIRNRILNAYSEITSMSL